MKNYMDEALTKAKDAYTQGEVPVGCVIVERASGRILAKTANRSECDHDPTAHAEIRALRDAAARVGNYRLAGATLYVTLEPCTMCVGAIVHSRVSRLVFGALEPKAGAVESARRTLEESHLNWRVEVSAGVLAEQCGQVISEFFSRRRREIRQRRKQHSGKGSEAP